MPELMELAAKKIIDFEILSVIAPGLQGEKTIDQFPKWFLRSRAIRIYLI